MYLFFKASLGRNREDWDWGQRRNEMDRETFAVFLHLQEEKEEEQFSSNYRRSRRRGKKKGKSIAKEFH